MRARKLECRECGADMGYGFAEAPLCKNCGQLSLLDDEDRPTQLTELPGETWEDIFK